MPLSRKERAKAHSARRGERLRQRRRERRRERAAEENERRREERRENADELNAARRQHHADNSEEENARLREWRQRNAEHVRAKRREHAEEENERQNERRRKKKEEDMGEFELDDENMHLSEEQLERIIRALTEGKTPEQRRDAHNKVFADVKRSPAKALLLFHLNSGCVRFGQWKHCAKSNQTCEIDLEALKKEILGEEMSEAELQDMHNPLTTK